MGSSFIHLIRTDSNEFFSVPFITRCLSSSYPAHLNGFPVSTNNVTELVITSLLWDQKVQRACFVVFLPMCLAMMVGNGLTFLTVKVSKSLHSPMYFFLSHLSLVETSYSSTIVPKFPKDWLAKIKTISLEGCVAQIFFFHLFGVAETFLLMVMAYDHYVAI